MKRFINRCLRKIGLATIPKSIGDDLIITWGIINKTGYTRVFVRYDKDNLKVINDAVSSISSHMDVMLKDLDLIPRPEDWITNEMWKQIEKEDKVEATT